MPIVRGVRSPHIILLMQALRSLNMDNEFPPYF